MAFSDELRRASFRGVPFGVLTSETSKGRRQAVHEYPFRDTPWVEDLGRKTRRHQVRGFLVQNARYGGAGDVIVQRDRMEAAAEQKGQATLVHPTRGAIRVSLDDLVVSESVEFGGSFELQFTLIEGGDLSFPQILQALGGLLGDVAGLLGLAGASAFVTDVIGPLQAGLATVENIADTAQAWTDRITDLGVDATNLFGSLALLGGATGRYSSGRAAGYVQGLAAPPATVPDLIGQAAAARAAVASAAAGVLASVNALGASTTPADVGPAISLHVAALAAASPDPADRVRLLAQLAVFDPGAPAAASPGGAALSAAYRRAAIAELAKAGAAYAPSSYDDAVAVRATIAAAIDGEIAIAGDHGADDVFAALASLRQQVVADSIERGGSLAPLQALTSSRPLPDVVLAMRRYGDPARADELVTQGDPPHPLFMPISFLALAD